jgi:hypothetical protein
MNYFFKFIYQACPLIKLFCYSRLLSSRDDDTYAIIHRLSLVPKLNAMGFFTISRETLTSVFSAILTYLIILVQFQNSN